MRVLGGERLIDTGVLSRNEHKIIEWCRESGAVKGENVNWLHS